MKLLFSVLKLIFHNLIIFPLAVVDGTMREEHHVDTKGKVGCVGGPTPPPSSSNAHSRNDFCIPNYFTTSGQIQGFPGNCVAPLRLPYNRTGKWNGQVNLFWPSAINLAPPGSASAQQLLIRSIYCSREIEPARLKCQEPSRNSLAQRTTQFSID